MAGIDHLTLSFYSPNLLYTIPVACYPTANKTNESAIPHNHTCAIPTDPSVTLEHHFLVRADDFSRD
ncbi:hypothetical protein HBH56_100750 [Parastagonospora nodorum]|uniref:Uncharacterized protein n=1 Tax=Phaeosphaeria nodorum (strain SN15 / ATCC MYA-4574 / FGSC 10173) TaxID=321614 RepID=Q0U598_PHANO|nr:hypothetical protein SNOG_13066 [Parastagonospora nodorum SN15]KAH3914248.1 hypothetical protein HBH56_100750 [Parastagonospora nodorum]EAT79393.1 hypothetical protein SNOG_13066 [Parastagonospora nodorum SN15]KAH3930431.1 hypothetical protein HBH54_115070 [Parastagonospora nodorum]KAH4080816.1 hypothetical protein HBH46_228390 [Parastagonospora nodorum]KAH4136135.1 hypothetical protein HBH45_136050 [Parastagonospora nodorum]